MHRFVSNNSDTNQRRVSISTSSETSEDTDQYEVSERRVQETIDTDDKHQYEPDENPSDQDSRSRFRFDEKKQNVEEGQ